MKVIQLSCCWNSSIFQLFSANRVPADPIGPGCFLIIAEEMQVFAVNAEELQTFAVICSKLLWNLFLRLRVISSFSGSWHYCWCWFQIEFLHFSVFWWVPLPDWAHTKLNTAEYLFFCLTSIHFDTKFLHFSVFLVTWTRWISVILTFYMKKTF